MNNGVNIGNQNMISAADLGGHRVLGMSGSLTNYIMTGDPNIPNAPDKFTKNKQKQNPIVENNVKEKSIVKDSLQITTVLLGLVALGSYAYKNKGDIANVLKTAKKNIKDFDFKGFMKPKTDSVKPNNKAANKTKIHFDFSFFKPNKKTNSKVNINTDSFDMSPHRVIPTDDPNVTVEDIPIKKKTSVSNRIKSFFVKKPKTKANIIDVDEPKQSLWSKLKSKFVKKKNEIERVQTQTVQNQADVPKKPVFELAQGDVVDSVPQAVQVQTAAETLVETPAAVKKTTSQQAQIESSAEPIIEEIKAVKKTQVVQQDTPKVIILPEAKKIQPAKKNPNEPLDTEFKPDLSGLTHRQLQVTEALDDEMLSDVKKLCGYVEPQVIMQDEQIPIPPLKATKLEPDEAFDITIPRQKMQDSTTYDADKFPIPVQNPRDHALKIAKTTFEQEDLDELYELCGFNPSKKALYVLEDGVTTDDLVDEIIEQAKTDRLDTYMPELQLDAGESVRVQNHRAKPITPKTIIEQTPNADEIVQAKKPKLKINKRKTSSVRIGGKIDLKTYNHIKPGVPTIWAPQGEGIYLVVVDEKGIIKNFKEAIF